MAFGRLSGSILIFLLIIAGCGDPNRGGSRTSSLEDSGNKQPREAAKNTTVPAGTGAIAQSSDGLFKLHIPAKGFSDVVVLSIQKQTSSPTPSIGVTSTYRVTWSPAEATIRESTAEDPNEFTAYFFMDSEDVEAVGADNLAVGIRKETSGDYSNIVGGAYNTEKGAFIAVVGNTVGDFTAVDSSKLETCLCDLDTEVCDELCSCDTACSDNGTAPSEPCGVGEWQCDDGQCILSSYECDNHLDCTDESDEDDHCPTSNPNPDPGGGTSTIVPDEFEPDNSFGQATTIEAGVSQTHSLSSGDNDYVTFTLDGYADVIIETNGSSGDTKLYLFNEANTEVGYDDDSGPSFFSRINKTGLAPGVYYASATGFSTATEITSYTLTLTITEPLDPPPTNVQVTWDETESKVVATWDAPVGGTTSYNVYYDDDSYAPIDPTQPADEGTNPINLTETTQSLSGLAMGSTIYVTIKAVNELGVESYASDVKSVTIPLESDIYEDDNSFATARYIEAGESQNRSIHVADDYDYVKFTILETSDITLESDGPTGDTLMYLYDENQVELAQDDMSGNGYFSKITDFRLEPGTYYGLIRAYLSSSIIADYTLMLSATAATPVPSGVTAVAGNGTVTISWQEVTGVQSYKVFYDDDPNQPFDPVSPAPEGASPIEVTGSGTTTLDITGLTNGTTYYFAVKAVGAEAQESDFSPTIAATPSENPGDPNAGTPDAPTNVAVSVNGLELVVTWDAVDGATSYKLYYDDDPTLPYAPQTFANEGHPVSITEATTITLTGFPAGETVYIALTAFNGALESVYSAQVSATPESPEEPAEENTEDPPPAQ